MGNLVEDQPSLDQWQKAREVTLNGMTYKITKALPSLPVLLSPISTYMRILFRSESANLQKYPIGRETTATLPDRCHQQTARMGLNYYTNPHLRKRLTRLRRG